MPRGAARASCRPSSRRCTSAPRREDAASTSTALILDRGRLTPGRVADGALGRLAFFLSEADRLVRREGRRRRPPLASTGRDITSRWRMRPTSSSVDAVRGIGDTVAHLHPPAGVEAHSSAPPTRPYVDIDGADATLDVSQEASSPEIHDELEALFQKLISLSQGL